MLSPDWMGKNISFVNIITKKYKEMRTNNGRNSKNRVRG